MYVVDRPGRGARGGGRRAGPTSSSAANSKSMSGAARPRSIARRNASSVALASLLARSSRCMLASSSLCSGVDDEHAHRGTEHRIVEQLCEVAQRGPARSPRNAPVSGLGAASSRDRERGRDNELDLRRVAPVDRRLADAGACRDRVDAHAVEAAHARTPPSAASRIAWSHSALRGPAGHDYVVLPTIAGRRRPLRFRVGLDTASCVLTNDLDGRGPGRQPHDGDRAQPRNAGDRRDDHAAVHARRRTRRLAAGDETGSRAARHAGRDLQREPELCLACRRPTPGDAGRPTARSRRPRAGRRSTSSRCR